MFNLTAYFTYIKTNFNYRGCCALHKPNQPPSEHEESQDEIIDLTIEFHRRTSSHGAQIRYRTPTPRPAPRKD